MSTVIGPVVAADLFQQLDILKSPPLGRPTNIRRFFAPWEPVHEAIMTCLNAVTGSLYVEMFGFDDPLVEAKIIEIAQNPDIYEMVCLDKTQEAGRGEHPLALALLGQPATDTAVGTSPSGDIAHRKTFIINERYVLCGSTNLSKKGEGDGEGHGQFNELTIIDDVILAAESIAMVKRTHAVMLAQMLRHAASAGVPQPIAPVVTPDTVTVTTTMNLPSKSADAPG
jgi:hypothetical protein